MQRLIHIPREKLQESKQASKVHWDEYTEKVKNALKSTKELGERLNAMVQAARDSDED